MKKILLLASLAVGASLADSSAQTTLYWYPSDAPNQGGDGSWNSTTTYWSTTSGGTKTLSGAIPTAGDSVVFGGANGTVTHDSSADVQLNDWKVETDGYVFRSSGNGRLISVNTFSGSGLANATFEAGGNNATGFEIRSDTAFSGTIRNGGGTQSVTKTGAGRWDLSDATLTYTGNTALNNGSLWMKTSDVNGLTGAITFGNAANLGGNIIAVGGGTITKALSGIVLGGAGNASSNTRAGFGARGGDLTLNFGGSNAQVSWGNAGMRAETITLGTADSTHKVTLTNDIQLQADNRILRVENGSATIDAELTGAVSTSTGGRILTREGAGTLRLSGTTNSPFRLNLTEGVTWMDGSWTSSVNNTTYGIQVAAGAKLGGDGKISLTKDNATNTRSALEVAGTLMAGRGLANQSLTVNGTLSLSSNSILSFGIAGDSSASDQLIREWTQAWSFQSDQRVQLLLNGAIVDGNYTYTLITGLSADPTVTGWTLYDTDSKVSGTFSYSAGSVLFNAHVIPEPATWILLGIGSAFLLWHRRRAA